MLSKENLIEKNTVGTLELADFPLPKGSVELLKQKWESAAASRPGPVLPHSPAPRARLPHMISCSNTVAGVSAESSRADGLQEHPDGPQQTQPFPISVKELRNRFEALGAKKETESERSSLSSELKSEPGSPSVNPLESAVKRRRAIFEKASSGNDHSKISEVSSLKPLRGQLKESTPGTDNTPIDFQETLSLKDRLALYKAAVSNRESINSFADTSEKASFCTVPGGLAAVRKQFEKAPMNSLQETSAQCQHQHQSVQPGHTENLKKLGPENTEKKKRRRRARRKAKKQPLPGTTEDLVVTDTVCGTSAKENMTHTEHKAKGSDGTQPCCPEDSMTSGPGGTEKKRRRKAHRRSKKQPLPVTTEDLVVTDPEHATSTEGNVSHADQKAKELDETQPCHTVESEKLSPQAQTSSLQKQKEKKKEKNRKKHFVLWFRMGCG